jgi:hypothetical protein
VACRFVFATGSARGPARRDDESSFINKHPTGSSRKTRETETFVTLEATGGGCSFRDEPKDVGNDLCHLEPCSRLFFGPVIVNGSFASSAFGEGRNPPDVPVSDTSLGGGFGA